MNVKTHTTKTILFDATKKGYAGQQGAVLLVSLIMLLLLTVVGTAAMNLSVLDSRMTSNARDRQLAFQAAESGLIAAEMQLADQAVDIEVGTTDGYLGLDRTEASWWFVENKAWWQTEGGDIDGFSGYESPLFVIEAPINGKYTIVAGEGGISQDLGVNNPTSPPAWYNFYSVTARGEGPGGSRVALQTNYARRTYNPE